MEMEGSLPSDADGEAGKQEINAPLVFQCKSCGVIVGDSWTMQSSDEGMETITLAAASNVSRAQEPVTSKEGADMGSTFHLLHCAKCEALLGRVYLTTARQLDPLRDMFTFSTAAVTSYLLGSSEFAAPGFGTVASTGEAGVNAPPASASADDITKLQSLILVLDDRVSELEDARKSKRKRR